MIRHRIIGAWSLREWMIEREDGRRSHPFGEDARGRLLYSAEGQMLAAISRAGRAALSGPAPRRAGADEKSAAFDGYFSYGGRFEIEGDYVLHHVEIALNPALVGATQKRRMHFDDAGLTLEATEPYGAGERRHRLRWSPCREA